MSQNTSPQPHQRSGPQARAGARKRAPANSLEAALDLFVEKGFAATRVDEVAARAGVSKGTLFLYFPSKEELFKAVVRENIVGRFAEWNNELERLRAAPAKCCATATRCGGSALAPPRPRASPSSCSARRRTSPRSPQFYQQEVILPGQRADPAHPAARYGPGRVSPNRLEYAVYHGAGAHDLPHAVEHSMGACVPDALDLDPEQYIRHADRQPPPRPVRSPCRWSTPHPLKPMKRWIHLDGVAIVVVLVGGASGVPWPRGKGKKGPG
jgi:AcrR family transcriptional regulator